MKIPWEIVGPVVSGIVIILVLVFGFIIKFKKLEKPAPVPPSNPPKNSDTLSKKSYCFKHEGDIASNKTAIKMACDTINKNFDDNSKAHGKIFDKLGELNTTILTQKTEILTAIRKNNG